MTDEIDRVIARLTEAAKVCRHSDPRCIDDPCPYGIWRVLCEPDEARRARLQERR